MNTLSDIFDQVCLQIRNVGRTIKRAFDYCLDCCIDGFYVVADALDYLLSIPVTISEYICTRAERAELNNEHRKNEHGTVATFTASSTEREPGHCKYCSGERCGLDEFKPQRE